MTLYLDNRFKAEDWEKAGYQLPSSPAIDNVKKKILAPVWIHFGAGNIFRAFPAAVYQDLLDTGLAKTGIVVAEGFDHEIIEKAFRPWENRSILVSLKSDGSIDKRIIASIGESLMLKGIGGAEQGADGQRLQEIFTAASLQIISFTITEKGYSLRTNNGAFLEQVQSDMDSGPHKTDSLMGSITALLYQRFVAKAGPVAMLSMDNCSHNGEVLQKAILEIAGAWQTKGLVEESFINWLKNPQEVSFPWTMIDKITPRPDESVQKILEKDGFVDSQIIVTARSTWTSAFVNAEEAQYLVIEDSFPNGRPALEKAGILFTDRQTVDKVERMKVTTCLNPLHTALAVFGCLLGYTAIHREMKDPDLLALIRHIGYSEGLPVVVSQNILDPKEFIDDVLNRRLPNPFLPDSPQRIASDTSQKIPIRFGQTIIAWYKKQGTAENLQAIPLSLAGWLRYLCAKDDKLAEMPLSPDPLLHTLTPIFAQINLDGKLSPQEAANILQPVLSRTDLFGMNLYEAGIGKKVESYFVELCAGPGAVRRTLSRFASLVN